MKKYFTVILVCLGITGCMFHPRSPADFPQPLHTVYFSPEKRYSILSTQLNALLESMNVVLVKNKTGANYTMEIKNDNFSYTKPDIVDVTLPTTINFSQTATVSLINNYDKKVVATKAFAVNEPLTLNSNQIYTANSNDLIRQQLNRELISLIYYWLISKNTKDALAHANHSKTAATTSR